MAVTGESKSQRGKNREWPPTVQRDTSTDLRAVQAYLSHVLASEEELESELKSVERLLGMFHMCGHSVLELVRQLTGPLGKRTFSLALLDDGIPWARPLISTVRRLLEWGIFEGEQARPSDVSLIKDCQRMVTLVIKPKIKAMRVTCEYQNEVRDVSGHGILSNMPPIENLKEGISEIYFDLATCEYAIRESVKCTAGQSFKGLFFLNPG